MAINTFSSGVNTSFSDELNDNFNDSYYRALASVLTLYDTLVGTNDKPFFFDTFANTSKTNTGTTTTLLPAVDIRSPAGNFIMNDGTLIDDCNDSSINAALWSTSQTGFGNVGEDTSSITASGRTGSGSGSALLTLNGASAPNLNQEVKVFANVEFSNTTSTDVIQLSDGTTHVTLIAGDGVLEGNLVFHIDPANDEVNIYNTTLQTDSPTTVDISSLSNGGTWRLRVSVSGTGGGTTDLISIYHISYFSANTQTYYSQAQSLPITASRGILMWNEDGSEGTVSMQVSFDGGSNYTTVSSPGYFESANPGTSMIVRADITATVEGTKTVDDFGIWYFA